MDARTMESKKTQQMLASKEAAVPKVNVGEFIGEVKEEVSRITWPSTDELKTYTQIVVGATFVLGLGIYCTDLIIQSILNGISITLRWITG